LCSSEVVMFIEDKINEIQKTRRKENTLKNTNKTILTKWSHTVDNKYTFTKICKLP